MTKTKQNKAQKILNAITIYPDWSPNKIAESVGATASYVWKVRKDWLEALELTEDMEAPDMGRAEQEPDMVNSPPHYTYGGIETIEFIKAKLTDEEFQGFCKGNVIKYISRAGQKGNSDEDLDKAHYYAARLVV